MITNLAVDSAIAIAERRANRAGSDIYAGRSRVLLERGWMAVKTSNWLVIFSGFFEPVFYLAAFGFGIGQLIGGVTDGNGQPVSYAAYIAPALLATSAMNGAIYDATWNVFFKMHFGKIYQGMMSTSLGALDVALGEITWALLRGLAYAIGFMLVVAPLGLVPSWTGLLAIPAAVVIAFGFAAVAMGITSYMKSFQQMDWINFFLLPMFLFSGTFYPLSVYPEWLQRIIQCLPLWQAVQLERGLMLGNFNGSVVVSLCYFGGMILAGLWFTTRRLNALFLR